MKLVSFAASYRENGNNHKLVSIASEIAAAEGASIQSLAYPSLESPFLREDMPSAPLPKGVATLVHALDDADGFIIAMPEHNWSFPASLKNLIDWISTLSEYPLAGKTALLMCATPSRRGGVVGLQQLRVPVELLGAWVYPQVIGIGNIYQTMNEHGLQDARDLNFLTHCVKDFVRVTRAMKG